MKPMRPTEGWPPHRCGEPEKPTRGFPKLLERTTEAGIGPISGLTVTKVTGCSQRHRTPLDSRSLRPRAATLQQPKIGADDGDAPKSLAEAIDPMRNPAGALATTPMLKPDKPPRYRGRPEFGEILKNAHNH